MGKLQRRKPGLLSAHDHGKGSPVERSADCSLFGVGRQAADDVGDEAVGNAGRGALDEIKRVA